MPSPGKLIILSLLVPLITGLDVGTFCIRNEAGISRGVLDERELSKLKISRRCVQPRHQPNFSTLVARADRELSKSPPTEDELVALLKSHLDRITQRPGLRGPNSAESSGSSESSSSQEPAKKPELKRERPSGSPEPLSGQRPSKMSMLKLPGPSSSREAFSWQGPAKKPMLERPGQTSTPDPEKDLSLKEPPETSSSLREPFDSQGPGEKPMLDRPGASTSSREPFSLQKPLEKPVLDAPGQTRKLEAEKNPALKEPPVPALNPEPSQQPMSTSMSTVKKEAWQNGHLNQPLLNQMRMPLGPNETLGTDIYHSVTPDPRKSEGIKNVRTGAQSYYRKVHDGIATEKYHFKKMTKMLLENPTQATAVSRYQRNKIMKTRPALYEVRHSTGHFGFSSYPEWFKITPKTTDQLPPNTQPWGNEDLRKSLVQQNLRFSSHKAGQKDSEYGKLDAKMREMCNTEQCYVDREPKGFWKNVESFDRNMPWLVSGVGGIATRLKEGTRASSRPLPWYS